MEPGGRFIPPFGDRDLQLAVRPPVHLGGSSRARAAPAAEPFERSLGDSHLNELVEVERGNRPGDLETASCVVATHAASFDDQAVHGLRHRVIKGGNSPHPLAEGVHAQNSKTERS